MSSNNKNNSNFEQEKFKGYGRKFSYYFDIFYRVTKGLIGIFLLVVVVLGALAGGAVLGYFGSLVKDTPIPTQAQMQSEIYNYDVKSTLYYANNVEISDVRSDLFRTPIGIENVSPLIIQGIVATEDENFFIHEGIVPKSIIRAGIQELSGAPVVTGGSTLTQQLVKQQILSAEVTHSRKAVEILYATHLENLVEKDEILEAYLNVSPFGRNNLGQNIAGIEEAAQGIFGVSASEVNLPQAAFLAGLPQSPIAYSPYNQYGEVKEDVSAGIYRQQEVLYSMYREGYIDNETRKEAFNYDISADFLPRAFDENENPSQSYVYDLVFDEAREILITQAMKADGLSDERISELKNEDRNIRELTEEELETFEDETIQQIQDTNNVIAENIETRTAYEEAATHELVTGGYRIHSTIDSTLHQAVNQRINDIQGTFGQQVGDYPVQVGGTLVENETGRVIAFVGGRDYEMNEFNNAFDSRRLSGSVMKPLLVYGPALAEKIITPATIIPDMDWSVPQPGQAPHEVKNIFETTYQWRDARFWLAISQNIPASRIYFQMLNDDVNVAQYIRALGIGPEAISDGDFKNPSAALGSYGAGGPTATEIAGAYAALGNGGVFNQPYVIEKIEKSNGEIIHQQELKPVRVWSEEVNYLLYDILRDVTGPNGTAPFLSNYMNFNVDLASKTGTSDDNFDVWYAGVTPKVSLTTWMGYGRQISLQNFDGLRPAQRNIRNWANIMNVVREVKPEALGLNETLPQPAGIQSETVLAGTGMKAGEVELPNGDSVRISGETKSEIFDSSNLPGTTTYDFAEGATNAELEEHWSTLAGSRRTRRSRSNNNNDEEDENSDEEAEEDNSDESEEE